MPEPTAAAVIVALPGATPTTLAVVLVAFLAIVTEAGTVTMPVGLAVRFTTVSAAAGADRLTVTLRLSVPVRVNDPGERLSKALVVTVPFTAV